jgi:NAD(P)-dependent dehydrogenase (short-subunit alcohol dehydrogenase family)
MFAYSAQALLGKKILVTGASSGIGRSSSMMLADCGAQIVLCGRSIERLNDTKNKMNNPNFHHVESLVFNTMEQIAADLDIIVKKHGPFDGVVHCAGVSLIKPMKLISDRDVSNVLGPSLYAALALGKVFSKKSNLKDGSSIVCMSSVSAHSGQQGMTLYSASKASIEGMIRSLASELADRSIRVNSIAAGGVTTEMHQKMVGNSHDDVVKAYEDMHLLGFGKPEDIAGLVVYLMSDISRWMTGATVVLDGGYISK